MRSRRDSTQRQIVQALRQIGCSVVDLSQAAGAAAWVDEHGAPQRGGLPDLLAAGIDRRTGAPVTVLLEVKAKKGKLRTQQQQFAANWRGSVYTVRSADEALMCFGVETRVPAPGFTPHQKGAPMNEQQFEHQRIACTRTPADAHTALWIAVVRQALRDASGGAPRHTLRRPADRRLAAGAAAWLDSWLPGWRRVVG